jgi:hypothetical protein
MAGAATGLTAITGLTESGTQLQQCVQMQQESELHRLREEAIQFQIQVMSASYDKSVSYTNLFMIGGYASFFTVWAKMYNQFSKFYMGLAGVLMLISLTVFIIWELYKMIFYSTNLRDLHKILEEKDPKIFNAKLNQQQINEKKRILEQVKIWWLVLVVTIIPALFAAGILISLFYKYIIDNMI